MGEIKGTPHPHQKTHSLTETGRHVGMSMVFCALRVIVVFQFVLHTSTLMIPRKYLVNGVLSRSRRWFSQSQNPIASINDGVARKACMDAWINNFLNRNLSDIKCLAASADDVGQTLSSFLRRHFPISGKMVQRLCNDDAVKVNGQCRYHNYHLRSNDHIEVNLASFHQSTLSLVSSHRYVDRLLSFYTSLVRSELSNNHRLRVLYEDDDIAVIFKPAGIHSSPYEHTMKRQLFTLEDLLPLFVQLPTSVASRREALLFPKVAHRLDYRVPGCIVAAKTNLALVSINNQFSHHTVSKEYRAILAGALDLQQLPNELVKPMGSNSRGPLWLIFTSTSTKSRSTKSGDIPDSSTSLSMLQVLESTNCNVYGSLHRVSLSPITGRRHQLREHCALLGTPILGDDLYHDIGALPTYPQRRQRLLEMNSTRDDEDIVESNQDERDAGNAAFRSKVRKKVGLCLMSVGVSFHQPYSTLSSEFSVEERIRSWSMSFAKHDAPCEQVALDHSIGLVTVRIPELPKYRMVVKRAREGARWQQEQHGDDDGGGGDNQRNC